VEVPHWDWPSSKWKHNRSTVGHLIHWSYAWLIATRLVQEMDLPPDKRKRNRKAVPIFGRLNRGELTISGLDRDYFQAMMRPACCAHCGAREQLTNDHLIPRSRGGDHVSENVVLACRTCNSSRRDTDLMHWYRQRRRFPTLSLMRHHLKLCRNVARDMNLLHISSDAAVSQGLPYDPSALPEKFPPLEELRMDWS
jgi:5-methylcytosine-specific restriction endonuclease McrA